MLSWQCMNYSKKNHLGKAERNFFVCIHFDVETGETGDC